MNKFILDSTLAAIGTFAFLGVVMASAIPATYFFESFLRWLGVSLRKRSESRDKQ